MGRGPGRPTTFHNGLVAEDPRVAALHPGVAAEPTAIAQAVVATAITGNLRLAKVHGATRTSGVAAAVALSREAHPGDPGCHTEMAVEAVAADTMVHHNLEVHGTSLGRWLLEPEDLSRK